MTSKKTTRHALFSSVVALILCCSMLLGTTYAWFTDEVTSMNNVITAGNLDVDVVTADGNTINGQPTLFNEITLWEPGVVAYETLTVKNLGTLALKYQMVMSFDKVNATKTPDGKTLADVLKVGVVNEEIAQGTTREQLIAKVNNNWQKMESFSVNGQLEAGKDAAPMTLVIYWEPSDIDNEYNMNNGKVVSDFDVNDPNSKNELHIDLGVHLFATQLEAETDSFGPDYDEDAIYTDVVVTNEAELVEALANGKDDMIIGIKGNVTWTTGAGIGSTPFVENVTTFAANAAPIKNITLLGLTEDATFTAIGAGVGAIGIDGGTVTFKNLKIVDKSVSYAENSWELGYLEFRGNTVFENCDVVNAIMMSGDNATFKNCSFNSHKDSEYAVWVDNGNATFENCTFTGARGLKMHEAYGSEVGTVVANNNTFIELSKKPGIAIGTVNPATTVVITNNEFIGTQAGDQGFYSYETDTDVTTFNFTYDKDNNLVAGQDSNLPTGLYQIDENTWQATNVNALGAGLEKADEGDTIVLGMDVAYTGNGYLNLTKDVTIDLNGNTLSTTSLGVVAKAGTIKNGTVSNPAGVRAALRTWSGVSIENVVVESPANGGITVASGNALPYIKNVTINAKTYGIELQYGASVDTIENVNIVAGENGIYAQAATIGNMSNVVIDAENAGILGQLKGVYDLRITLDGTNEIVGGNYGIYLFDEGADITTPGSAYLTYADASVFSGSVKNMEFAFGQKGKLVINGTREAATAEAMLDALANGDNVELTEDVLIDVPTLSNAYGATGINVKNGQTIDGAGHVLDIQGAYDTWDSGISTTGGVIKNITITGSFRGVFVNHNSTHTEKVVLENVIIDGTVYTISCDEGNYQNLEATNCTFNGWTSYAKTIGNVKFNNCSFGEGSGYAFCRPYAPTEFVGCAFEAGFTVDPLAAVTFENCTLDGVLITAENVADLVTGTANVTVK